MLISRIAPNSNNCSPLAKPKIIHSRLQRVSSQTGILQLGSPSQGFRNRLSSNQEKSVKNPQFRSQTVQASPFHHNPAAFIDFNICPTPP